MDHLQIFDKFLVVIFDLVHNEPFDQAAYGFFVEPCITLDQNSIQVGDSDCDNHWNYLLSVICMTFARIASSGADVTFSV